MLKKILILCALLFSLFTAAQTSNAYYYYREGVKAVHQQKYALADSLYTLSLSSQVHPNTYFNRALARQKLNLPKGYYEDLVYAADMGDTESYTLLRKDFERVDTLPIRIKLIHGDSTELDFYHVAYSTHKTKEVLEAKFNKQNKLLNVIWYIPAVQTDTTTEESAEFIGGARALFNFIQANVNYPSSARKRGISGKAVLKFIVAKNGTIERIELLKGVEDCKACDQEAMRVVASMPRWKPSKIQGQLVRTYFSLPFSFQVQE